MTIYYQFSGPSDENKGFDDVTLSYLKEDCSAVKHVLVIASDLKDYATTDFYFQQNLPWFNHFIPAGFTMYLLDGRVSKNQAKILLEKADCIHLMGGYTENQQALLKHFEVTKEALDKADVVFGTSAGAMALGPVLMGTHDPNLIMEGLHCSPFVIWPHYEANLKEKIIKQSIQYPNMIALEDDSGLRIEGTSYQLINKGIYQIK